MYICIHIYICVNIYIHIYIYERSYIHLCVEMLMSYGRSIPKENIEVHQKIWERFTNECVCCQVSVNLKSSSLRPHTLVA
jgi:hypothetical protein